MTSPSEPVESREQPRAKWVDLFGIDPTYVSDSSDADPRDASIRNLETLRDVHRRTIDDLISEAQTAGATIDELRAEGEKWKAFWRAEHTQRRDKRRTGWEDEFRRAEAALAAALAEVSRLREQGEAAMAIHEKRTDGALEYCAEDGDSWPCDTTTALEAK